MRKAIEEKARKVEELIKLMKNYKVIGILDIHGIPNSPFKKIKKEIPGIVKVMKKTVISRALEKVGIKGLEFGKVPAIILTNEDPFDISKELIEKEIEVYAKPGQIAQEDIVIKAGPTPFPPGPMVTEFNKLGIKVRPQAGKLVILKDVTIAKKGEEISESVASMLRKLDIKPMKIRIKIVSAYENGKVYGKELNFDVKEIINKVKEGYENAFKLSISIPWFTSENIGILISNAYLDAKKLVIAGDIFVDEMLPELFSKAESEAKMLMG